MTFAQIAAQCGYASAGAARGAIMRELQRRMSGAIDEWRREALNELDELQAAIWQRAADNDATFEDGDGKKRKGVSLFAQDRALAIIQERNKLLGLYPRTENQTIAPTIIEVSASVAQALRGEPLTALLTSEQASVARGLPDATENDDHDDAANDDDAGAEDVP